MPSLRALLTLAWPIIVSRSTQTVLGIYVFINIVVAGLGTAALGAMMAVFNINGLSFMPAFGVASAGAILVGQNIGAGRKNEVPAVKRRSSRPR